MGPDTRNYSENISAMANTTPIVTTVTKTATKEKTSNGAETASRINILDFCEEHYEDILPVMDKIRRDKRREVHTMLDFGENSRKSRRIREDSQNSSAKTLSARYRNPSERLQIRDRLRNNDGNVFGRLGRRRENAFKRLSDTYSPSTTKSGLDMEYSKDDSHSRGRPHKGNSSPSKDRPRNRGRSHDIEESYGNTCSYRTWDKHRYHSHGIGRSCSMKRGRNSESPLSRVDPFTPRIRNFKSSRKQMHHPGHKGHNTDECVQLRKQIEELRVTRQKVTQCFAHVKEIMLPPLAAHKGTGAPLVIEAEIKNYTRAWMNFMIVRSPSSYNGIIERPGIREIQAVPSTAHGMLKFPVKGRIVTIRSTILTPTECTTIAATPKDYAKKAELHHINFKVAIHPDFPDQEITNGGTISIKARTKLILPCQTEKTGAGPGARQGNLSRGTKTGRSRNYARSILPRLVIQPSHGEEARRSNPSAAAPLSVSWTPTKAIIKYRWPNKMKKIRLSTPVTGYIATQNALRPQERWHNIPATSRQRFDKQIGRNLEIYVDDLVIKSHTETELLRDIEETFCTLRRINMKLNQKIKIFATLQYLKEVHQKSDFHWTPYTEQAFKQLKQHLARLPMPVASKPQEELIIYLSASYGMISAVLMIERDTVQTPIYFVSRALQTLELNYTPMEKLVLALVCAAKRLRIYFQAHPTVVITDQPIKHVMSRPDMAGRLQK
nr:reverse transcriptase domain-containing protein [Tanacetum cinerariifolium]